MKRITEKTQTELHWVFKKGKVNKDQNTETQMIINGIYKKVNY